MAWFSVRVELLNNATGTDYAELHKRMQAAGFKTSLPASDGKRYALPPAEYFRDVNLELSAIIAQVKAAVSSGLRAGLKYRVVAFRADAWASHNLSAA